MTASRQKYRNVNWPIEHRICKICFYLFLDLISDLFLDVFDLQSGRELGCIFSELQSGSIWRQACRLEVEAQVGQRGEESPVTIRH